MALQSNLQSRAVSSENIYLYTCMQKLRINNTYNSGFDRVYIVCPKYPGYFGRWFGPVTFTGEGVGLVGQELFFRELHLDTERPHCEG